MKKILILQDNEKLSDLLDDVVMTTKIHVQVGHSLVVTTEQPETLDALKTIFGGAYFYDEHHPTPELLARVTVNAGLDEINELRKEIAEMSAKLTSDPTLLTPEKPNMELTPQMEHIRDQVNDTIDTLISEADRKFLSSVPLPAAQPAAKQKAPKEKKPLKLQPAPRKEIKSWHVIVNGEKVEIITITEKKRRLAAGEFETGTILKHPASGLSRVTGAKGAPQGVEPHEQA